MFRLSLLSASVMMALSPVVMAQKISTLDDYVVSGTRTDQSSRDISSSVESVQRDDMDRNLANDMQQALKYSPGVEVHTEGRFGISQFNIRGVEGSRVKVMVDGVQQPVPYNPGATEQRSYPNAVEVDTLKAIEVNKGPASTLYGSDAIGGSIMLRTLNPEDLLTEEGDDQHFGIKAGYASANDELKSTLRWAQRSGKLEALIMGTYAQGHETQTHDSGADIEGRQRGAANPADSTLQNLLAKAFYRINDNHRIGATLEVYRDQYDEQELSENGYTIMPGYTYTNNYNEDERERVRLGVEHEWQLNAMLADQLNWSLNAQQSGSLYKNYDTTAANGSRRRDRDAEDQSLQLDAQFDKRVAGHQLIYGLSYNQNDFQLDNADFKFSDGSSKAGATGLPDADLASWGIFLQDQYHLMDDRLIVTSGVRYDRFKATPNFDAAYDKDYDGNEDSAFTFKLGSVFHLNDQLSVFGQVAQGFKAPTVEDLYYFYNQGAVFNPNPNLKAEKSLGYELGLRGQYSLADFELATFYTEYDDFIATVKTGTSGGKDVYTKQNLDKATIYGAELSATLHLDQVALPDGSYLRTAVSYAKGENDDNGRELNTVAPLTGVLGLGLQRQSFGGELTLKVVDSKDEWQETDHADAPAYSLVDLTSYYKPTPDLTLRAGLFNALNEKYWAYNDMSTSGSGTGGSAIDTQPGRNWSISADYSF